MKRFFFTAAFSVAVMAGFAEKGKPYNHLNYLDDPEEFSFAVLADMYGADEKGEVYRDGFNRAVKAINTLRPEFVMSVGDLIPFAWHHNEANIRHQHKVLEERINRLEPPFFCTVGNHDIASSVAVPGFSNAYERSSSIWRECRGNPYYSFVRKNVLFVVLNCQDDCRVGVRYCGLSKEQYAWFQKTLETNKNVRWTCIFMHLPMVWRQKEWLDFELKHLLKRKYTVFAGDWHNYVHVKRHGRDYYVLSVTGGAGGTDLNGDRSRLAPRDTHGEMDHIMWVTMTKDGPSIANLDLNGVVAHDFLTQNTSQSMGTEFLGLVVDYPEDPTTWKRLVKLQEKKKAILAERKVEAKLRELRKKKTIRVPRSTNVQNDATALIRSAISDGGCTVVFGEGSWLTEPLKIPSNVELVFEEGAELQAKPSTIVSDAFLTLDGSTNVVIRGIGNGGVLLSYRTGEQGTFRHAIKLSRAEGVRIENLQMLDFVGDSVSIDSANTIRRCKKVKISNCTMELK